MVEFLKKILVVRSRQSKKIVSEMMYSIKLLTNIFSETVLMAKIIGQNFTKNYPIFSIMKNKGVIMFDLLNKLVATVLFEILTLEQKFFQNKIFFQNYIQIIIGNILLLLTYFLT